LRRAGRAGLDSAALESAGLGASLDITPARPQIAIVTLYQPSHGEASASARRWRAPRERSPQAFKALIML
jgi:hypothetical protein